MTTEVMPNYTVTSRNVYRRGDFVLGLPSIDDVAGVVGIVMPVVDLTRQLDALRAHGVGSLNYSGPTSIASLDVHMYPEKDGAYSFRFTHANDEEGLAMLKKIAEILKINI